MSKYIPKVGEAFEWSYKNVIYWSKAKALIETERSIGYEDKDGFLVTINKECEFRPIPTKADDELYNLVLIIEDCYESGISVTAKEIQQAGFTIPKKIKRRDVENVIANNYGGNEALSCWTAMEICELLGDLVERDEGGAE